MLERFKSALLLILIGISLHFTSLYFGRVHAAAPLLIVPGPGHAEFPDTEIPTSYIDLFSPHYLLVHNGAAHYRVGANDNQYGELWRALKQVVGEARNTGPSNVAALQPVTLSEWQSQMRTSYEYRFAGSTQLNYWWLTASRATLQKFPDDIYFNRLLLPVDGSGLYLQNTYTLERWKWQWSGLDNAELLPTFNQLELKENQRVREVNLGAEFGTVAGAKLYAPSGIVTLPEVLATLPITENNKADLVKLFFSIVPRVQKFESLDGSLVRENYITARQQVLSLYSNGLLEYSERPSEGTTDAPGRTTIEQFEQAFTFILSHGGWPKGTIAAGMQPLAPEEHGYRFSFLQLYNGLPVLDWEDTLAIEVVPGGVKNYRRLVYKITQPGFFQFEVRSLEEALNGAKSELAGRSINDAYLAYYQRPYYLTDAAPFQSENMYLFPVWTIELEDGERLFVHAYRLLNDPGLIRKP